VIIVITATLFLQLDSLRRGHAEERSRWELRMRQEAGERAEKDGHTRAKGTPQFVDFTLTGGVGERDGKKTDLPVFRSGSDLDTVPRGCSLILWREFHNQC
jgi:hypothetical protein